MFSSKMYSLLSVIVFIFSTKTCISEMLLQPQPSLNLHSPGELEFTDVVVKRIGDNLTLVCELSGETASVYVWNFVPHNANLTEKPYIVERNGSHGSRLLKQDLEIADSGRYVCSAPPFSQYKYILVQPLSSTSCAHGAFSCGSRCVLPAYVCDGFSDCVAGEDESPALCGTLPCARADRLNCSSGRCIAMSACCERPHALCRQPACCDEHKRYSLRGAFVDVDMPPVFDDRHAPDDYGFIQSTIYTVTACALIFMIAVVLLVSAICKMHMKRAALRSYAHERHRDHYTLHLAQLGERGRYPPCYEAAALLDGTPLPSPTRQQCGTSVGSGSPSPSERRTRLAALTSVFTSRYRQVPTQCSEVEMTTVPPPSLGPPLHARSPAAPRAPHDSADQGSTDTPQQHRLTLQLGRFQLSLPRFGRGDARPDTPNVAEINIDDLDFVRLNSNETYTLNGRTIRLLGGDFSAYGGGRLPPYAQAARYKRYGPPPAYLSTDALDTTISVDEEARSNIEMPPCYDELSVSNEPSSSNNPIVMNRNIIMCDIIEQVVNDRSNGESTRGNVDGRCSVDDVSNVAGEAINNIGNLCEAGNVRSEVSTDIGNFGEASNARCNINEVRNDRNQVINDRGETSNDIGNLMIGSNISGNLCEAGNVTGEINNDRGNRNDRGQVNNERGETSKNWGKIHDVRNVRGDINDDRGIFGEVINVRGYLDEAMGYLGESSNVSEVNYESGHIGETSSAIGNKNEASNGRGQAINDRGQLGEACNNGDLLVDHNEKPKLIMNESSNNRGNIAINEVIDKENIIMSEASKNKDNIAFNKVNNDNGTVADSINVNKLTIDHPNNRNNIADEHKNTSSLGENINRSSTTASCSNVNKPSDKSELNGNKNGNLINSGIDKIEGNGNVETFKSVIDNLPAIDSDVNANDSVAIGC